MPKIILETFSDVLNKHIDRAVEEKAESPRNYLGLSNIGMIYDCPRKAWFAMHGYEQEQPEGRILRLFRTGNDIEENVINDLRLAGFDVMYQQKELIAPQGDMSFTGHMDGVVCDLDKINQAKAPCLFECKSTKNKYFNKLTKLQDYCKWSEADEWKPHSNKAQVHVYAFLEKLTRILVCVENKDTSERYWERFPVDNEYAEITLQLAFAIRKGNKPIRTVCPNPTSYKAKYCDFVEECFKEGLRNVKRKDII